MRLGAPISGSVTTRDRTSTPTNRDKATDEAAYELARMLKDEWDDSAETPRAVDGTMYSDLLNAALSEVDWDEIADAYVTECGRSEIERELTEVETVDTDD
jgi:hypothetical protein